VEDTVVRAPNLNAVSVAQVYERSIRILSCRLRCLLRVVGGCVGSVGSGVSQHRRSRSSSSSSKQSRGIE
jgi:hypothetical protein